MYEYVIQGAELWMQAETKNQELDGISSQNTNWTEPICHLPYWTLSQTELFQKFQLLVSEHCFRKRKTSQGHTTSAKTSSSVTSLFQKSWHKLTTSDSSRQSGSSVEAFGSFAHHAATSDVKRRRKQSIFFIASWHCQSLWRLLYKVARAPFCYPSFCKKKERGG